MPPPSASARDKPAILACDSTWRGGDNNAFTMDGSMPPAPGTRTTSCNSDWRAGDAQSYTLNGSKDPKLSRNTYHRQSHPVFTGTAATFTDPIAQQREANVVQRAVGIGRSDLQRLGDASHYHPPLNAPARQKIALNVSPFQEKASTIPEHSQGARGPELTEKYHSARQCDRMRP